MHSRRKVYNPDPDKQNHTFTRQKESKITREKERPVRHLSLETGGGGFYS